MGILDDVVSNTAGGASIISEQNDRSQISVDVNSLGWDASEYGMTREQAVAVALEQGGMERLINAANQRAKLGTTADGRVAMFAAMVPPWHGLGTVIDRAATADEALRYGGLAGWDLAKLQVYVDFQDKRLECPDKFAVVRQDTGDVLGVVGNRYQIFHNEDVFAMMDEIVERGARYDTAGSIGNGERVWMLANMPESRFEVCEGDEVEAYILATTTHDGTGSIRFMTTSNRVVCANTLRMAMNGKATKSIWFRHTANVAQRAKEAQRALGLAQKGVEKFKAQAEVAKGVQIEPAEYFSACLDDIVDVTAAEQQVTRASIKDGSILQAILDIKETEDQATEAKRYERALKKRREVFDDIMERYESDRNNGMEAISGTGWAAFNAVTESIDHGRGSPNFKGDDRKRAESRFDSVISGRADEIKQNALELVLEQAV